MTTGRPLLERDGTRVVTGVCDPLATPHPLGAGAGGGRAASATTPAPATAAAMVGG